MMTYGPEPSAYRRPLYGLLSPASSVPSLAQAVPNPTRPISTISQLVKPLATPPDSQASSPMQSLEDLLDQLRPVIGPGWKGGKYEVAGITPKLFADLKAYMDDSDQADIWESL